MMLSDPFADEPRTDHDILRELWQDVKVIKVQTEKTNGRVTKLERFQWLVIGGLMVVSAIVVPLFVKIVLDKSA